MTMTKQQLYKAILLEIAGDSSPKRDWLFLAFVLAVRKILIDPEIVISDGPASSPKWLGPVTRSYAAELLAGVYPLDADPTSSRQKWELQYAETVGYSDVADMPAQLAAEAEDAMQRILEHPLVLDLEEDW